MFVRVFETPSSGFDREVPAAQRSFEIHPLEGGRFHLKLWGKLPRGWADRLCRGLARSGLTVHRGFAKHGAGAEWIASFELERCRGGLDPMLVDYLALAVRVPSPSAPPPIALEHYHTEEGPEYGGCLRLEVVGPDQLGFLGGLLERLSFLGLVPEEMEVETGPGGVHDRFLLRTRAGALPGPATVRILREVLAGRLCTGLSATG